MKKDPFPDTEHDTLRQRAEQCRLPPNSTNSGPVNAMDTQRLLQELEIHQIELEMQNQALEQARNEAEQTREIYRDLYDFAPVGYFTLSQEGFVRMANLTGATLLGLERNALTGYPFSQWIVPKKRGTFKNYLAQVFKGEDPGSLELEILHSGGNPVVTDIAARKGANERDCRMTVTDITRRKAGEEATRLLKISTRSNRKLQAEVVERMKVQASLELAREELSDSLEKAKAQRKQLQNLSHALIHAQEDERRRISRELHDGIVQALVAIQYEFEVLSREPKERSPKFQAQITRTQNILEGSIDLVHNFAFDLRPSALDNLGLGPTLETFAVRFHEDSKIKVSLDFFKDLEKIDPKERTMLYRVAQEAFRNVANHAQAENIRLSIFEQAEGIRMEITDDGIGIDPDKPEPPPGEGRLGLIGMKERVEMLGGTFSIHSKQGLYTTIRVDLPKRKE